MMGCRNITKGQRALAELQARNPAGTLSLLELDITDDTNITSAVESITRNHGVLDILINNAGIGITTSQGYRASILETINTNAVSALVLTEALLPLLKKSADPRIINVTSGLGSIADRSDPASDAYNLPFEAYRMSKAALNMATACMHAKYQSFGAKAWAYCPGLVATSLTGEEERARLEAMGVDGGEESAKGIVEIVQGRRDHEAGLFVRRDGGRWEW
jgi:NAD(P)-dependent dehydrogenase (short-subunit alcohol dehydrogenase family)